MNQDEVAESTELPVHLDDLDLQEMSVLRSQELFRLDARTMNFRFQVEAQKLWSSPGARHFPIQGVEALPALEAFHPHHFRQFP
jgi:hypothetical protein